MKEVSSTTCTGRSHIYMSSGLLCVQCEERINQLLGKHNHSWDSACLGITPDGQNMKLWQNLMVVSYNECESICSIKKSKVNSKTIYAIFLMQEPTRIHFLSMRWLFSCFVCCNESTIRYSFMMMLLQNILHKCPSLFNFAITVFEGEPRQGISKCWLCATYVLSPLWWQGMMVIIFNHM